MRRHQILGWALWIVLIGMIPCGFADTAPEPLDLEGAVQRAVENNPEIKALESQLEPARARVITAGVLANPSLVSDNGIAERSYRLGIQQFLETGGQRSKRIALAKSEVAHLRSQLATILLDIRTSVKKAYVDLYHTQQHYEHQRQLVTATETWWKTMQEKAATGSRGDMGNIWEAELLYLTHQNDLEQRKAALIQARNTLNALMGLPLETTFQLAMPLPKNHTLPNAVLLGEKRHSAAKSAENPVAELIQEAWARRPEIQANQAELETVRRALALARAERAPDVVILAGPDKTTGEGGMWNAFIYGAVELPVFNRQQGPIQEANARQAQVQKERQILMQKVALEVANAYEAALSHRARVQRFQQAILPLLSKRSTWVQKQERSDNSTALAWFQAGLSNIETMQSYHQTLHAYETALIDLQRAVGE